MKYLVMIVQEFDDTSLPIKQLFDNFLSTTEIAMTFLGGTDVDGSVVFNVSIESDLEITAFTSWVQDAWDNDGTDGRFLVIGVTDMAPLAPDWVDLRLATDTTMIALPFGKIAELKPYYTEDYGSLNCYRSMEMQARGSRDEYYTYRRRAE